MSPLSLVFSVCAFASGFAMRIVDPLILPVADQFEVTPATAALLTSAYALPYALAQPFLGPLGDRFGKVRCIQACMRRECRDDRRRRRRRRHLIACAQNQRDRAGHARRRCLEAGVGIARREVGEKQVAAAISVLRAAQQCAVAAADREAGPWV